MIPIPASLGLTRTPKPQTLTGTWSAPMDSSVPCFTNNSFGSMNSQPQPRLGPPYPYPKALNPHRPHRHLIGAHGLVRPLFHQ